MPTTASVSHRNHFFLRPSNFFQRDPSMSASDAVFIEVTGDTQTAVRQEHHYIDYGTPQDVTCTAHPDANPGGDWKLWEGRSDPGFPPRPRHLNEKGTSR